MEILFNIESFIASGWPSLIISLALTVLLIYQYFRDSKNKLEEIIAELKKENISLKKCIKDLK